MSVRAIAPGGAANRDEGKRIASAGSGATCRHGCKQRQIPPCERDYQVMRSAICKTRVS
jgi:hypothetical protein